MTDLSEINEEFYKPFLTVLKYFRYSGVDIFEEKNIFLFKIKNVEYIMFLFYMLVVYSHWCYVITEYMNGINLVDLSVDLSFSSNAIEGCLMYLHINYIKTRIKNYVKRLEKVWPSNESLTAEAILLKQEHLQKYDFYNYAFLRLLTVFVNCYLSLPLLIIAIKKFILNQEVAYTTALQFKLPFDYKSNFFIFIIFYFLDYVTIFSLAYLINCILLLSVVTMNQLRILFVLLQEDFKESIKMKEGADMKLKQTIKKHSILSDLLRDLGDAYGALFAIHLAFLSATICFYGIAARLNGRLEDFKNFLISILQTINIYHCCKHGQLVTDSALDIATVIYDSPWEDLSRVNKKIILLTILRCQRATFIRSMNITDISLKTFITVMNLSWSLISLITKLYGN